MQIGTKEGIAEEVNLVRELNKKHNLLLWRDFKLDLKNSFAIRVVYQQYGFINDSKVFPKADIFLARGFVPNDFLLENDYYLDESMIERFNLSKIDFSGISVKLVESKKFQISKLSVSTFKKIFKNNVLAAGASIYCSKSDDLYKNNDVLNGWGVNIIDFSSFFSRKLNIPVFEITNFENVDVLKKIKKLSNFLIEKSIKENKFISDYIFFGIGNFVEPYTATWLFINGEIKRNYQIPFKVTTGSGRSNGIYTISIKPVL